MLPSANHAAAVEIGEERPQPSDLDPRFTFENFVVGKPNELAHAAARRKEAAAEARMRFARIKSGVIGPIFDEVVARLAAEGFFGETVNEQNDASGPISLNVNLSEDEEFTRQGSLQVRFEPDKYTCEFGTSTMAKASSICAKFNSREALPLAEKPRLTAQIKGFHHISINTFFSVFISSRTRPAPSATQVSGS
jgi:Bacterial dnaA  protein